MTRATPVSSAVMDHLKHCVAHPLFTKIVDLLPTLGNSFRKGLLILARNMGTPKDVNGNMYELTYDTLSELRQCVIDLGYLEVDLGENNFSTHDDALDNFLSHPLYAGACIMAACISPYAGGDDEEQQIRLESYLKEINTMDRRGYLSEISFAPIFGDYGKPMHYIDIPTNRKAAQTVHFAIDEAIRKHSSTIQFPRYSKKATDSESRSMIKRKWSDFVDEDESSITPAIFEKLRYITKTEGEGRVQMKQRWAPNGITPRTYFVGDESAFRHARMLQGFTNTLCDELEITNRRSRVQPWRQVVPRGKHALFYDLTSFTSNLPLQYTFLKHLANYTRDIPFEYFDIVEGVAYSTLGSLIDDYADLLNHFHEWYCEELKEEGVHGPAGFLGVFGNIATCTFIHGAVLLMLTENTDEAGVAGDDACIITDDDNGVFQAVRRLGSLAVQKTFSTLSDAIYLKRRTFEGPDGRLRQWRYMQLPSFLPWMRDKSYARFMREMAYTRSQRRAVAASSLDACFRSLTGFGMQYDDSIRGFLERYYQSLRFPTNGFVPQYMKGNTVPYGFIPGISHVGSYDFVERTLETLYPGYCRVKVRGENVYDTQQVPLRRGIRVLVYGSGPQQLTFLQRIGHVRRVSAPAYQYVQVFGEEGLDRLMIEYKRKKDRYERDWSAYEVVKYIPSDWWPGCDFLSIPGVLLSSDVVETELGKAYTLFCYVAELMLPPTCYRLDRDPG